MRRRRFGNLNSKSVWECEAKVVWGCNRWHYSAASTLLVCVDSSSGVLVAAAALEECGCCFEPECGFCFEEERSRMPHRVTAEARGELMMTTIACSSGVWYMNSA